LIIYMGAIWPNYFYFGKKSGGVLIKWFLFWKEVGGFWHVALNFAFWMPRKEKFYNPQMKNTCRWSRFLKIWHLTTTFSDN
jgi:hypothetical protein